MIADNINRYILDELRNASIPKNEIEAAYQAYKTWALSEIMFRIMDRPFDDPQDIIMDFSVEMLFYSRSTQSRKCIPNPFEVSHEAAKDILLAMEHPKED